MSDNREITNMLLFFGKRHSDSLVLEKSYHYIITDKVWKNQVFREKNCFAAIPLTNPSDSSIMKKKRNEESDNENEV
jgi:hypothetical protein